jgi:hypothetical protein
LYLRDNWWLNIVAKYETCRLYSARSTASRNVNDLDFGSRFFVIFTTLIEHLL